MKTAVMVTEHAELVDVAYLSPEWYEVRRSGVAASEVAAILGLSPYQSRFDLWWEKRTGEQSEAENRAMRRGRRYEALILEDFADEHPELYVSETVTVRSVERPWQLATPDGLAYESSGGDEYDERFAASLFPVAVIEAKTGQRRDWGDPGTDDIPVEYRCQVLWQMDTLGLSVAYLPVRFGDQYEEYVVEYHEADVLTLRQAAEEFLADVREDRTPDVDSHTSTLRRLKHLHHELTDTEAVIPETVWRQYAAARRLKKAAEDRMRLAENRVRAIAGPAARIRVGDDGPTFSHTVSDIKARTQQVAAHQRNVLNWPRRDAL